MAYANAHVKVTLFGDMLNGQEEWSTGFHMGSAEEGAGNFGVNSDWVNSVLGAWQTFFGANVNGFHSNFRTLGVKAGIVLPTGKYDLSNIVTRTYATPVAGGNTAVTLYPPQIALVASLESANRRDLGGKGRMFLPGIGWGISANGVIDVGAQTAVADGLRTFFDTIEDAAGSPGYVMIASQGRKAADGTVTAPPVNRRVTNVRVGNVFDTQRRRRNGLVESYVNATLSAAP